MTNGKTVSAVLVSLALSVMFTAQVYQIFIMTQKQAQQAELSPSQPEPKKTAIEMADQSGTHMAIFWRTPSQSGMSPREVLESTIARMQYEQGTPLGNDRNAKALVKAMEALAILEGRPTETAEGFPIIE